MMKRTIICLFSVCLIAGVGWAQDAPEGDQQEVAAAEQAGESRIEEVIVTARKTEESLDDIPLTIQAFTDDAIQELGIVSVENVADLTPGIHFSNYDIRDPFVGAPYFGDPR